MATLPKKVTIFEVGARDGLQNEAHVSTENKIEFINRLSQSGLRHIEAGSFVSPKWVPQMADSMEVMQQIQKQPGVIYSALTPNIRGFELALAAGAEEIAIFGSSSEGFSQHNINCSISESLKRFEPVMLLAKKHQIPVRGYLSCVADCPYDGPTPPQQVADVAKALTDLGCYQISLGDTIGTGTPLRIARMIEAVASNVTLENLAVHFHDTWGQALTNIYQALSMGVNVIDSSTAGLGGCPYAEGASGNVATEDVIYLCQGLGIETGVDLDKIASAGWMLTEKMGKQPTSRTSLALKSRQYKKHQRHDIK